MKKILIAEDNDSNYILMSYILKKYFEYERAKNGQEAVEKAKANQYDAILMDIKMPIMDGLEGDRQAAMEAGCNDFLAKPVSSDVCLATLEKIFGKLG